MALPNFPVEGGCVCGSVRYRISASPLSVYTCHCKDCQRFSGGASSISMMVKNADFEVLQGATEHFEKKADSGNVIVMNFCVHCHGWLWNEPAMPGTKVVRAGSLDDLNWAEPIGNIWTESRPAWVAVDDNLVNFPKGPSDRQPLFDAWTAAHEDGVA